MRPSSSSRGSRAGSTASPPPFSSSLAVSGGTGGVELEVVTNPVVTPSANASTRRSSSGSSSRFSRLESLKSIIASDGNSPAHSTHAPPPQQNCMLMAELGRLIRNLHQHHAFNCKNQQGEDAQDDENARLEQIRKLIIQSFSTFTPPGSPHMVAGGGKHHGRSSTPRGRTCAGLFSSGYLPKTYSARLIYLACLADNHGWWPFEQYQVQAFSHARVSTSRAAFWLSVRISGPILTALALGSYVWMLTDTTHVSMDPYAALLVVTTLSALFSLLDSLYGWWCTGVLPDRSSNAQNLRQNATLDLKECFDELAFELIDLYKVHRTQARLLALLIDPDLIKYRAKRCGADHWDLKKIFRLFDSALQYIREGTLPRHHVLLHYIVAPTHEGNLEGFGNRGRSESVGANISNVIHRFLPMSSSVVSEEDDAAFVLDSPQHYPPDRLLQHTHGPQHQPHGHHPGDIV